MSKKPSIFLITAIIFVLFIIVYASKNLNKHGDVAAVNEFDLHQLTRVDVKVVKADGTYEVVARITDEETIDILKNIFKQITWEPNAEAKMARQEDIKVILHFKQDEKRSKGLSKYAIWFELRNALANIVSDNPTEGLGTLENDVQTLSTILLEK